MAELPKYIMLRKVSETKTGVEYQVVEELPTQSNAPNTLKALTNADRIRSMTDEELADFMRPFDSGCPRWKERPIPCTKRKNCGDCWLDWLKEVTE